MHIFDAPVSPLIKAKLPKMARDRFALGTVGEFCARAAKVSDARIQERDRRIDWTGGLSYADGLRAAEFGDMASAAKSDEMLARLENQFPAPSARHEWIDDVCGAVPNVPAYLAGQPLNMRRKVRRESEAAPLAVVVNLLSDWSIKADAIHARGIAILALVRTLTARRPVELWVGVTCAGARGQEDCETANIYCRVETSPMDLARAAFLISHPAMSRNFGYLLAEELFNVSPMIPFAYHGTKLWGEGEGSRKQFRETVRGGFPHIDEVLAVPMATRTDPILSDPVAWILEHVKMFGAGDAVEDEAA